jgi:hypothetical protein
MDRRELLKCLAAAPLVGFIKCESKPKTDPRIFYATQVLKITKVDMGNGRTSYAIYGSEEFLKGRF